MKIFYTARSYSGENKSGEMKVRDERELAAQLRAEGFVLTSFKELAGDKDNKVKIRFWDRFFGISLKDKLMFTRNLSVMVASGLPLSRAIKSITLQSKSKKFRKVLEDIYKDIQAGQYFSQGLAKYPGIFNELFVNMVKVGETSGNLEEVLNILAVQIEKEHELMSKIKGAMTYPAVILVAMLGIAVLMLTYILPKITGVFKDMDAELPASTRFVIGISDILTNHSVLVILSIIILIVFFRIVTKTDRGRRVIGFLAIHIPIIKNIIIKINCARFCRIYSSLLKSGVPVVQSLKIISNTLTNYYYKKALKESVEQVQKGVSLSKIITSNSRVFPVLVGQMVEVGEETGKTEKVLLKLAEFYEEEMDQISKNMASVIEPVLMIVIGSAVGFFAVSMLQPMYSLMENIK